MNNEERTRNYAKDAFKDHELTIVENTKNVQMFRCQKPGTWTYGFHVLSADNLLVLNGDIDTIIVEPGYERNGIAFMRGSIDSEGYFLSKIRHGRDEHREYSTELALQAIKENKKTYEDCPEILEKLNEVEYAIDESGKYGEMKFYEAWCEAGLDEPPNVRVITAQTIFQLEAFKWLTKKLEEINFVIGETK